MRHNKPLKCICNFYAVTRKFLQSFAGKTDPLSNINSVCSSQRSYFPTKKLSVAQHVTNLNLLQNLLEEIFHSLEISLLNHVESCGILLKLLNFAHEISQEDSKSNQALMCFAM